MTYGGHMKRLRFLILLVGVMWIVLWGRIFVIQGPNSSKYREMAKAQRVRIVTLKAKRGSILDRNGDRLTSTVKVPSYGLEPKKVEDRDRLASALAGITGKDAKRIRQLAGSNSHFVYLHRHANRTTEAKIDRLGLSGVVKLYEEKRFYPFGTVGSQLLGSCNVDMAGIDGTELFANEALTGRDGKAVKYVDALSNSEMAVGEPREKPVDGSDVVLTIDRRIQEICDNELANCVEKTGAVWGGAVVVNAETGEVLAMSNMPSFDPNDSYELRNGDRALRRNRIVTDMMEPGSVMKVVTWAEGIESGVIDEDTKLDCENGVIKLYGKRIHDDHKLGKVSAREAFVHSSNIAAIKIAQAAGTKNMYRRIRDFGFGTVTGIDVPDESKGLLRHPKKWSKLALPTISYGHGISVSPIQMAMAYAAVANGGTLLRPYMIQEIRKPDGRVERTEPLEIRRVMSKDTALRMESLLTDVVKSGTGQNAALPNVTICGKTGTAKKVSENGRGYEDGLYIPSFVGYVVDRDPKIVCLVMVDSPRKGSYYGSQVAAPVFKNIVNGILNIGTGPWSETIVVEKKKPKAVTVVLPDVRGEDMREALANLRYLGLRPVVQGDTTMVARQFPAPGVKLESGDEITLYSPTVTVDNSEQTVMPSLKGRALRDAVRKLSQSRLEVRVEGSGVVERQTPAAGTLVDYGTVCMIICKKQ